VIVFHFKITLSGASEDRKRDSLGISTNQAHTWGIPDLCFAISQFYCLKQVRKRSYHN